MSTQIEHLIIGFAVAIVIDTVLLLLGMKMIAKIRLSFGAALLTSFIACTLLFIIGPAFGFFLANHIILAMILTIVIVFFVQAVLFRITVEATGQTLPAEKACILSLLVIFANFFVVSPIVALFMGDLSKW
jgi:hypothetical protein